MSSPVSADGARRIDLRAVRPVRIEERPEDYQPTKGLPEAVEAALILGRPLLVTGEPGTGKTQLAAWVAHQLGMITAGAETQIHKFEAKSTSVARDLFYTYDAIAAFQERGDQPKPGKEYVTYQALGRAIIEAYARSKVEQLLPQNERRFRYIGPRRAVVLIDEIDKAPRDFPNDLLNEIERLYFRIPEFDNEATPGAFGDEVPPERRPVIVITSNSEKSLPEPFLRRCVFHNIPFPKEPERLETIVKARLGAAVFDAPIANTALKLFLKLRGEGDGPALRRKPSTAELLDWMRLIGERTGPQAKIDAKRLFSETIGTLVKENEDQKTARAFLQTWSPE